MKIICFILFLTDPNAATLDWSTSSIQLHVTYNIILSFLRTMDIDRICEELTGKKTPEELIEILFYFDLDLYLKNMLFFLISYLFFLKKIHKIRRPALENLQLYC